MKSERFAVASGGTSAPTMAHRSKVISSRIPSPSSSASYNRLSPHDASTPRSNRLSSPVSQRHPKPVGNANGLHKSHSMNRPAVKTTITTQRLSSPQPTHRIMVRCPQNASPQFTLNSSYRSSLRSTSSANLTDQNVDRFVEVFIKGRFDMNSSQRCANRITSPQSCKPTTI